jgi:hypothetical protein
VRATRLHLAISAAALALAGWWGLLSGGPRSAEAQAAGEPAAGGAPAGAPAKGGPEDRKPTQEVLQAIRLLLSGDPAEERRGEQRLRQGGMRIVPQLRYWLRRVRFEADRVERLLGDIRGQTPQADREPVRDLSAGEFLQRKVQLVEELTRSGNYARARELAEAILLLDENSPFAWELRRAVRHARERLLARELEPRLDVTETIYELGENPQVVFRLINRSQRRVRIEVERGILGEVQVLFASELMDGTSRSDAAQLSLRGRQTEKEIVLEPGEIWKQEVPYQLPASLPIAGMVARVKMQATFRPRRWEMEGKKEDNVPLTVAPAEFWVVPPGQKRQSESPLKRLVEALYFGKDEAFFIGGQLSIWAGESDPILNEELVETLVGSLGDLDPPRLRLAMKFLAQATGKGYVEAAEWRDWWARYVAERRGHPRRGAKTEAPAAALGSRREG